jgi:hypothetical protein
MRGRLCDFVFGKWESYTSFSVMGEMAEVQHAASLFLGLDQHSNKQAACSTMLTEKLVKVI